MRPQIGYRWHGGVVKGEAALVTGGMAVFLSALAFVNLNGVDAQGVLVVLSQRRVRRAAGPLGFGQGFHRSAFKSPRLPPQPWRLRARQRGENTHQICPPDLPLSGREFRPPRCRSAPAGDSRTRFAGVLQ